MTMRLPLLLLSVLSAMALPAKAREVPFERPAECKPVLTVQFRGCEVSTFLTCDGAEEIYHREEITEPGDGTDVEHTTSDGLLIGLVSGDEGSGLIGITEGAEGTSIADVRQTGRGLWRQNGHFRLFGNFTRPMSLEMHARAEGVKHLNVLEQYDVKGFFKLPAPMAPITFTGKGYVHPDFEFMIDGETNLSWAPGEAETIPHKPARLIYPGEPGFDSATPEFDCNHLSFLSTPSASSHS